MAERRSYKVDTNIIPESNDLLRIINNGIDDIIVKLKNAVDAKGDGPEETIGKTNDAVVKILKVFSDFQVDYNKYDYGDTKIEVLNNVKPLNKNYRDSIIAVTPTNTKNEANILDLNTEINYESYKNDDHELKFEDGDNSMLKLNMRLSNCTQLEQLYLNKHFEIIKIFGFVVNLFDKYKYAIKVILFLLKNLVRAKDGDTPPPPNNFSVNLPKPLIKNINLLLKDQANIQTIIKDMENVVNTTDANIRNGVDITPIQTSLDTQGSPPGVAQ